MRETVSVILMHSRGEAGTNKDYSRYGSVVGGVARELGGKVEAIVRGPGGVRRWLVMARVLGLACPSMELLRILLLSPWRHAQ